MVFAELKAFADALIEKGHLSKDVDLATFYREAQDDFGKKSATYLFNSHTRPLRQVVGMLSVPEMAELAETLITIESLKERVTKPTESVSGPVDVAVISKGDGFIWIKRKHYFKPELNPRFIMRQSAQQGENNEGKNVAGKGGGSEPPASQ